MKLFLVIKRVWKILWGNKPDTNEVFYIGGTEVLPPPLETDEEKCCLIALVDKNVAMSKEQAKAAYRAQSKACGVSGKKI